MTGERCSARVLPVAAAHILQRIGIYQPPLYFSSANACACAIACSLALLPSTQSIPFCSIILSTCEAAKPAMSSFTKAQLCGFPFSASCFMYAGIAGRPCFAEE
eukprot:TRINITY_DN289_c0_g1_i1.p2 TRINITY_DN289_c0_g1~~TRINITY_DN289_c0_g1_i1.p2  ORF type:complete len:104 (-),score=6.70 TRINITY_DN289_c0_g1_i1:469-780(-)